MDQLWLVLAFATTLLTLGTGTSARAGPLVGAYYYPWYGTFSGGHSLNQSLRGHLVPSQPPAIGHYSSRSSATIASHIDQSHLGNIDFWAVSWWGPGSAEDTTFRTSILAHSRQAELRYAAHYESTGRLGTFDNPNYRNLIPDFRYLANNYFNNPGYLRIDGRPVVFMYVTRAYFNSQTARDAVANLPPARTYSSDRVKWFAWVPIQPDGTFFIDGWPADEPLQLIALCEGYIATSGKAPDVVNDPRDPEEDPSRRPKAHASQVASRRTNAKFTTVAPRAYPRRSVDRSISPSKSRLTNVCVRSKI